MTKKEYTWFEVARKVEVSIQALYRQRRVKELRPDLYELLLKGKIPLTKAYQIATGRQLKIKKTACLNPEENEKLELLKEITELTYSEILINGLNMYFKHLFGASNEDKDENNYSEN